MVKLTNRNILLTGDTVHLQEAIDLEATMPPSSKTHAYLRMAMC
jgi:hypothetical protein